MDRRLGQSQAEVLADANRLASAGLRHAALDLLFEFLDEEPESAQVLAAIGRLYLLEKNYPKSVLYLQKSLHVEKVARSRAAAIDAYDEDFDEQDLAFITSQNTEAGQHEVNKLALQPSAANATAVPELPDGPVKHECDESTAESEEIEHVQPELEEEPGVAQEEEASAIAEEPGDNEPELGLDPVVVLDDDSEAAYAPLEDVIAREVSGIDAGEEITGEAGDTDDEELLGEEIYVDGSLDAATDEAYELSWEEIDDLDGYTSTPQQQPEPVLGKGKLSRAQRARQIAVDVMSRFDLDHDFLPLLQTIFFESGWGAARIAVERELTRGILREELALAREVRHFWWHSERYWTTFRSLYSNGMNQQAEATYKIMSWAEALRLIACFPGLPGIEEIEDLVEETFLLWYESRRLRRSFPVFFKFLKYRTASMPGTLSCWEPRCFDTYEDDGVEDSLFRGDGAEEELRRRLWELGIDLYKVREYENKLRAHPEELEE